MKKLLCILFMMMPLVSMAQNYKEDGGKYEVYCDVKQFVNAFGSSSITITIGNTKYVVVDSQGKDVKIKEPTDAINLLAKRGWKLVSSFGMAGGNGLLPTEKHYTLKKEIIDDKDFELGLQKSK